jgi:serine/threonine-protein kinase
VSEPKEPNDTSDVDSVFEDGDTAIRPPKMASQDTVISKSAEEVPVNERDTNVSPIGSTETQSEAAVEQTIEAAAAELTEQMPVSHKIPDKIGRYVVLDRLGAGGMAEVFLAKQDGPAGFEKTVVIKRSFPHLAENERYVDMFMREAKIAARLNHPNIVQIYDFGSDDGLYFIAMEYVDGLTLHRLAKRAWRVGRSLPIEIIVQAMADAALGLNHAHNLRGQSGEHVTLVHRDISPDNLMVNRDGATKVLDFGIAKASDTQSVTRTGEIKGKIPFMSPEQVQGQPVDGRSDLYSLGICFYWMLTGKRPFQGSSDFVTMQAVIEEHPEKPSHFNPSVPAEIDAIVMKLLEKDAPARYQSGQELFDELNGLLPANRSTTRKFVGDLMSADIPDKGDAPVTISEGFLPATPVSTRLTQTSQETPVAPGPGKSKMPIAAAGAGAFLLLIVLIAVLATGGDDAIDAPPVVVPPPPTTKSDPIKLEPPKADPPPKPKPKADPPPVEPPSVEPPSVEPPPVEDPPPTVKDPDPPPTITRPNKRKPAPRAKNQQITLKGPSYVRFQVGRGWQKAGVARLPTRARTVKAKDTRYGATFNVPISDGRADFDALPNGSVQFRVYPWAEISIGQTALGKTPLPPLQVKAGTYRVKLKYNDQAKTQTVTVRAGKLAQVKVRF